MQEKNCMIFNGDSEEILKSIPEQSVDLVFTSPPYFNAKPEYSIYENYQIYLQKMQNILSQCHKVLKDGRFIVVNVSPIIIKRESRSKQSKRLALPFDFHLILTKENFDFIDDIHWEKPVGAAGHRGRRFSKDRNPLQYKTIPVTEYILVYRKKTDKLIDWNIRKHNQELVKKSKIKDGYEKTNIWKIHPSHSKLHPATFPIELATKVISYYSFEEDIVLDPFAGIGTTGEAAVELNRKFILIELQKKYFDIIQEKFKTII